MRQERSQKINWVKEDLPSIWKVQKNSPIPWESSSWLSQIKMKRTLKLRDSTPRIQLKPKRHQWPWLWLFKQKLEPLSLMTNPEKNLLFKTLTLILPKPHLKFLVGSLLDITLFRKWLQVINNSIWSLGTPIRSLIIWKHFRRDLRPRKVSHLSEKSLKFLFQARQVMFF